MVELSVDIDDLDFFPSTPALSAPLKLSAVLDTINHDIPLKCLVGKGSCVEMAYFLPELFQFQVVIAPHLLLPILCGIPQVSVLGPLVFSLNHVCSQWLSQES